MFNTIFSMFFEVCSHFDQQLLKFNGISSSQSKEIFHSCCKINFASSIDGVKSPNRSKTEDIKLSKPLFNDGNEFMTSFTLIISLFGFHNIPKALSNEIPSKSRLTDWQFADKSSWEQCEMESSGTNSKFQKIDLGQLLSNK